MDLRITDASTKEVGIVGLCQKNDGTIEDPSWAKVHVFRCHPTTGAWTTITNSPFIAGKVQGQTGLFGITLDRSSLTAGTYALYFEVLFSGAGEKTGEVGSLVITAEGQDVNTVVITWTRTGSSDLLVGRRLTFKSGTYNLFTKVTNVNGQITVGLPDGTYSLQPVTSPNYDDDNPTPTPWELVVAGDTNKAVSSGVRIVTPPASPNLCRVEGFILTPGNQPEVGATVKATLIGGPYFSASAGVVTTQQSTVTDVDGYFYIDLTKSDDLQLTPGGDGRKQYRFIVASIEMDKLVTVPNVASIGYDQI